MSGTALDVTSTGSVPVRANAVRADVVLVGGGLANSLIAHRLRAARPDIAIVILEAGDRLGGNHTWSFHETDLTAAQVAWMQPFVQHRWPGYAVRFPRLSRDVPIPYRSMTSERLHAVLSADPGLTIRLGADVAGLAAGQVTLASGEPIEAALVIDGRGFRPSPHLRLAYQKFLGQELRLAAPHGLDRPILMDATVPQHDGYRFVYVLPFGPDRLLVEDTYYSGDSRLNAAALRQRIAGYVADAGWQVAEILREEEGVLPITLAGDIGAFWAERQAGLPVSGLRAGLFHPVTGYSLPEAAALADLIAGLPDLSSRAADAAIRAHARSLWRRQWFLRALNRLLFRAGAPAERYRIMQRFYGLPDGLVRRFYAGRLTLWDRVRILTGRPPVTYSGAIRALVDPCREATR